MIKNQSSKISGKLWFSFILFGLIGQIAWSVENMYFNVFLYNSFNSDIMMLVENGSYNGILPLTGVKLMVQLSGITATIATLLAGALSDKWGNRKKIISVGYIVWGVTVLCFAFINKENTGKLFGLNDMGDAISVAITIIIVMDCIMTFFGSSANDAAFNAWVTDVTDKSNRGKAEGVLSALPLLAMLIVAGGFGIIKEAFGYPALFGGMGAVIVLTGVAGIFLIKDSPLLKPQNGNYIADVFYGFRPKVIKNNVMLYITLIAVAVYGIAMQVFFPYLIIYMEHYLLLDTMQYSVVLGVVIILSAVGVMIFGRLSDKRNKINMLFISLGIFIVGLVAMFFTKGMDKSTLIPMLCVSGTIAIFGYVALLALFNAMIRDYTPTSSAGRLQGIRIFFYVLLPMFIGPEIGDAVIRAFNSGTFDDPTSGAVTNVPVPQIFIFAAAIAILTIVPLCVLKARDKKEKAKELSQES